MCVCVQGVWEKLVFLKQYFIHDSREKKFLCLNFFLSSFKKGKSPSLEKGNILKGRKKSQMTQLFFKHAYLF